MERRGGFARPGERDRRRLIAPLAVFAIVLAEVLIFAFAIVHRNGGDLSFPLDDAFIHLAIAKHLAFDGVYGVTAQGFTAASSSILWPWLLAGCDRLVGDHLVTPLVLNVAAVLGLLLTAARGLRDRGDASGRGELRERYEIAGALLAIAFFAPLGTLAMLGMEHTTHAWAVLALLLATASTATGATKERVALLFGLAAAATSLRYESLGVAALCALALLVHRRYRSAVASGLGAIVPPLAFAAYAHAHGAPLLPTSVLLKAHGSGGLSGILRVFVANGREASHLVAWIVLLVGLRLALRARTDLRTQTLLIDLIVGASVLQLAFGRVGWFYRYEAYLVVAAVYALAELAIVWRPKARRSVLALVLLLLALPIQRAVGAQSATVAAAGNVHDQQMRVATFLQRYFPDSLVAVNDVGAVGYFRDGPLVDLLGLADLDVARARGFAIDHPLSREQVTTLTAGAKVAVLYEEWFEGAIPTAWRRVDRWTIENNRVCAFPSVAIYATDDSNDVPSAAFHEVQGRRAESGK